MGVIFFAISERYMKAAIAKTVFITGADGSLAAPDIYGKPPQAPYGATNDKLKTTAIPGVSGLSPSTALSSTLGNLLGTGSTLKDAISTATKLIGGDKSVIENLKTNMIGNVLSSAGYPNLAKQVPGLLKGDIKTNLLNMYTQNNPQLKVILGGVETLKKLNNVDSIDDLLAVAGEFTGNTELGKVLNISAELNVAKSLITMANDLGLPALGNAIINRIDNAKDKKAVKLDTLDSAAKNSNLGAIGDTVNEYGSNVVNGVNPKLVITVLSSYTIPEDNKLTNEQLTTALISACNKIDADWMYKKRKDKKVINYEPFMSLSTDARKLLLANPTYTSYILSAESLSINSAVNIAKGQYPYLPVNIAA